MKPPKTSKMVRVVSEDGVGYSVVELSGTSHIYAAAVPRNDGSLVEQTRDALRTIEDVIDHEGQHGQIVQQAVFLRDAAQWETCRAIIRDFYGREMPATTFILQPPCSEKLVSIEALGVGRAEQQVQIERLSEGLVVTRHNGVSWYHCSQIMPSQKSGSVYDGSLDAFKKMSDMLASQGVGMDQVIRTWLYLGDIVGPEGDTQRYKELNRARTDFFRDIDFGAGRLAEGFRGRMFPASTGIGTSDRNIVMSCIAVDAAAGEILLMPLENPKQTAAFDYNIQYGPESPKFCRAMAFASGKCATIFISGTASITDSETRWIGDVEKQTHQTLDNIEALIGEANFRQHGWPGFGTKLDDLAHLRVYIKHPQDYQRTRAVCEERLGLVPTVYAVGDVCRDDLLVEIEGVAFSTRCTKAAASHPLRPRATHSPRPVHHRETVTQGAS
jgi:enamine deaminase RidA (YjgF/YER057c/UK114 family)